MLNRLWLLFFLLFSIAYSSTPIEGFGDYDSTSSIDDEILNPDVIQEEIVNLDPNLRDLEDSAQDFVLETKRIYFEEYPDAFNPSVVRWQGRILMSFRTYHPKTRATNEIALCHLDENFHPIDTPQIIKFHASDPYCLFKRQDPRLVAVGERLYIVYNNVINGELRRMLIAELMFDGKNYFVDHSECLIHYDGENPIRSEKNWTPFDYNGQLHLAYSLLPHRILRPIMGTNRCELAAYSLSSIQWNWGVLRGGTPALLEDGPEDGKEYLSIFHSCKSMETKHSQGKNVPHYFMGAYTFSSEPPFEITRISTEPIIGKNFYHGKAYKTWKPLSVVFPSGLICDEKFLWVFYGRQDHEIWVAKLDKKALLKSLAPVSLK